MLLDHYFNATSPLFCKSHQYDFTKNALEIPKRSGLYSTKSGSKTKVVLNIDGVIQSGTLAVCNHINSFIFHPCG